MTYDKKVILDSLRNLQIPFDKNFYNMKLEHYKKLSEDIGFQKVYNYLVDILLYYKDDEMISEKARVLLKKLDAVILSESSKKGIKTCVCGFELLEDYEFCPICNAKLYTGSKCFYKNTDNSCSIDSEDCKWANQKECGKLNE